MNPTPAAHKTEPRRSSTLIVVMTSIVTAAMWASAAHAEVDKRFYISPMYSQAFADNDRLTKDGKGGLLAVGRQIAPKFSFELYLTALKYDADEGEGSSKVRGGGGALSYFPFAKEADFGTSGLYGLLGVGFGDGKTDIATIPNTDESRYLFEAGVGYLLPIVWDIKLRLDARYRYDRLIDPYGNFSTDGVEGSNNTAGFEEPVLSAGLLIPLGRRPAPPPPPPVEVVAPLAICSDTTDNDGDGQTDFPNDPGCTAADDNDETDPPVCSDGKDNDGDGLIDFPSDKGCSAADDTDEVDPCKSPAPGEIISLKGCGTGDVIVLRGVNFEFDKSRLTANAKTILDGVAAELEAYPGIKIELGGHTDAKGSDEYNQRLSEQRAASVVKYLTSKGIAGDRMTSAGYGETRPVADNETDEGREINRRVELKITEGAAPVNATAAESAPAADAAAPIDPAATDGAMPEPPVEGVAAP